MENIVDIAINEIIQKYNPDTIILYGSRARGDFKDTSDIDIACFGENLTTEKDAGLFNGVYLDLWIYPTSAMTSVSPNDLRFSDGVLVLDKDGKGSAYLKSVSEYLAKGPEKLNPSDITHTKEWIRKMLGRVQNLDIESNYRKI